MISKMLALLQLTCIQLFLLHVPEYLAQQPRNCDELGLTYVISEGDQQINATINNVSQTVSVYCEMGSELGGWTVFQRRTGEPVDFYRNWTQYQKGFGDISHDFWMGNDLLSAIVSVKTTTLKIDLWDNKGNYGFAIYDNFRVDGSAAKYRLASLGNYIGTAGDGMSYHVGKSFSTYDRDNDQTSAESCAQRWRGAWWYGACYQANLNGVWSNTTGLPWIYWPFNGVIIKSVMKFRSTGFNGFG